MTAVKVVDSGVGVCTMSVMGRMVEDGAVVSTVSTTGGVEESTGGSWSASVRGEGVREGETVARTGEGGGRGASSTHREEESNCGRSSQSMRGSEGVAKHMAGVDAGSSADRDSDGMGMTKSVLMEGGRLS